MKILKKCFQLVVIFIIAGNLNAQSPVEKHGALHFENALLKDQHNKNVQLKGMSLFWSQWQPQFYNKKTVKQLKEHWGINVIRAAMAVEHEGYLENPKKEKAKIYKVIDAAIDLGIYVIVDWHDHHAEDHEKESLAFFTELSSKYGKYPNIIYETYNEPLEVSWEKILKPYHSKIISAIRKNDPDNLIICGTPKWSQNVLEAANDPLIGKNIGYTLHFYAGTHQKQLRDLALKAIKKGLPIFVTEFGTTNADGDGSVYYDETEKWLAFMDKNNISWCNWSIADKNESSAALFPGTTPKDIHENNHISPSGKFLKSILLQEK